MVFLCCLYKLNQLLGGVCDCGDEQAWNSETFCLNHRPRPPSEEELKVFERFVPGLKSLAERFKSSVTGFPDSKDEFANLARFFAALPSIFGG